MGNKTSANISAKKHVIIVGGSFAGLEIAVKLWDHLKVTIIDSNDYMEHIMYSYKSLVEPNIAQRSLSPMANIGLHFHEKMTFKQAKLTSVNPDNSINVELPDGRPETMSFDFLVICTGFSYASPIKSQNSLSIQERTKELDEIYERVKNAESILVAGGGIVGCEVAGELAVAYGKEKKIGLCIKGEKLLQQCNPRFGEVTEEFFKTHNVNVHRNVTFSEETTKELGYEFSIQCLGYIYKTDFFKKNYSQCLSPSGQIFVNDLFQISSVDPKENPTVPGVKENIFAFGDCCLTSLNETKNFASIKFLSDYVTKNIIQMSSGQAPSNQIPERISLVTDMSLGPDYGILQINGMIKFGPGLAKEKMTYMDHTQSWYRDGNLAEFQKTVKIFGALNKIAKCMGCCCPCVSMGINHTTTIKSFKPNK